ncbi:rCG30862, partial [Rattus norvegicus]
LPRADPGIPQI